MADHDFSMRTRDGQGTQKERQSNILLQLSCRVGTLPNTPNSDFASATTVTKKVVTSTDSHTKPCPQWATQGFYPNVNVANLYCAHVAQHAIFLFHGNSVRKDEDVLCIETWRPCWHSEAQSQSFQPLWSAQVARNAFHRHRPWRLMFDVSERSAAVVLHVTQIHRANCR